MTSTTERESAEDDPDLVRRALAGDPLAESLLARHLRSVPRILCALNARLGRPLADHDLADVAQDTVVILLRKLRGGEAADAVEGWIYRACSYELMNAIRHRRRGPRLSVADDALDRPDEPALDLDPALDLEEIDRGMRVLDPEEATAIRAKFFGGATFDEIAARLGVSQGTIKTQFYRGLVKLHAYLRPRYREEAHARASAR